MRGSDSLPRVDGGRSRGWWAVEARIDRDYRKRTLNLHALGFRDYSDYLASPLWREIRERRMAESPLCYCCGRPVAVLHHRDYSAATLQGRRPHALVSLCRRCHTAAEFAQGRKVCLAVANRRVEQIRSYFRRRALTAALDRARAE